VTEVTNSSIAPRLLIVTDHTELGRAIEQHVSIIWPAAECRIHAPLQSGRLHSGFNAVGYDVVLLDDRIERGQGEKWLDNLLHRNAFPPILYLARADDPGLAQRVVQRGAID
jgi:DNA-binding response OmpR family regulator